MISGILTGAGISRFKTALILSAALEVIPFHSLNSTFPAIAKRHAFVRKSDSRLLVK